MDRTYRLAGRGRESASLLAEFQLLGDGVDRIDDEARRTRVRRAAVRHQGLEPRTR